MSRPKVKEFRSHSQGELDQKKQVLEQELFDLRQKKVTGQLDKPHLFKQVRKQIAQVNTIIREAENAKRTK